LDEPTAAALGYGMVEQENLLVIDFGGNAGFIPVVGWGVQAGKKPLGLFSNGEKAEKSAQKVKQQCKKVGQNLGGSDIDNWLLITLRQLRDWWQLLTTRLAERLKFSYHARTGE